MKKKAICYDFDCTLSVQYMQNYNLVPYLGYPDTREFWKLSDLNAEINNMDNILSYMQLLLVAGKRKGLKITKEFLADMAKNIEFFPGVESWFKRINAFGLENGVEVEHYIISSGLREMIEACAIGQEFRYVFASHYVYDEYGVAIWPAASVNYTNKTQHLHRISKGIFNFYDGKSVNAKVAKEGRYIPFDDIIYIGDGDTDVPSMLACQDKGGNSICVFDERNCAAAEKIFNDNRARYAAPADYSDGSELDRVVKLLLRS